MNIKFTGKSKSISRTRLLKSWDKIKVGDGVMVCLFVYNVFSHFRRLSKKDFKSYGKQKDTKVPFLFLVNFTGYCVQKGRRNSKPYIKMQTYYGKEKICFFFFVSALNFVFVKRIIKK
jgi:hypothetical protein